MQKVCFEIWCDAIERAWPRYSCSFCVSTSALRTKIDDLVAAMDRSAASHEEVCSDLELVCMLAGYKLARFLSGSIVINGSVDSFEAKGKDHKRTRVPACSARSRVPGPHRWSSG
jgi:hypothetical protein